MKSWESLKDECLNCTLCELSKTRTNVVFGGGNDHSKVLFIGEGPGEREDLTGEPFVGRSGQLLDKFLAEINLDRSKIFIANMVKCRPPKNRNPKRQEVASCIDFLYSQIKMLNPKIIVCLGRVPASHIIAPDFKITKQHGEWIEKDGIFMMGTFHPAALLRNPSQKSAAMEDFLSLRGKMKELGI